MSPIKLKWSVVAPVFLLVLLLLLIYYSMHVWSRFQYTCNLDYTEDPSMVHVKHYCNSLSKALQGQEGLVSSSDGYHLLSVHAFIRHGDRQALYSLPRQAPVDIQCHIDAKLIDDVPELENYVKTLKNMKGRGHGQDFYEWATHPSKDNCEPGELTPLGVAQHVRNGLHFKKRYQGLHQLLDTDKTSDQVFVRSTEYSRTFQSSVALLYGFLPKLELADLHYELCEFNTMCNDKTGLTCDCPAINNYIDIMSGSLFQMAPNVRGDRKTMNTYEHYANVFGLTNVGSLPKLTAMLDVNMLHICHHRYLPGPLPDTDAALSPGGEIAHGKCVSTDAVKNIYDAVHNNGKRNFNNDKFQRIVKLKFYPMLNEIKERIRAQIKGESPIKFALYSGHDSTIEPLAALLGFSFGRWAQYASRIVIELYSKTTSGDTAHFIRVVYEGEVVTDKMPFCKDAMKDSKLGLCHLDNFIKFIEVDLLKSLGETDYKVACNKPFHINMFDENQINA